MKESVPYLEISREAFVTATKPIAKLTKLRAGEEGIVSFDGLNLLVEIGGGGAGIPATGSWSGEARVSAKFLMGVIKVPPAGSPITFKVAEGRLHVGTASFVCQWQAKTAQRLALPVNATLIDCIRVSESYTDEQIHAAGLTRLIEIAREGRDARLKRAAEHMKDFGVTEADLHEFIRNRARAR